MKKLLATGIAIILSAAMFVACTSAPSDVPATQTNVSAQTEESANNSEIDGTPFPNTVAPEKWDFTQKVYPTVDKKLKFVFIQNYGAHPYPQALVKYAKDECEIAGIDLTIADALGDPQKQVDLIKSFVTQKYDAIINEPIDLMSCLPAYQTAYEAGIPIIECAINSDGETFGYVKAAVYGNTFEQGMMAAEGMMKVMPDGGNIVILEGQLATSGQVGLTGGFLEAIKDKPQYKVLDKQTTDWMRMARIYRRFILSLLG